MALKILKWHSLYMGERPKAFTEVSDILGGLRLPKSVKEHLRHHEIWSKWSEIVGFELSRVTSPNEVKSKVLEINVLHQAWAQQLHFLKPSILGKIRALCPSSQVKDLHFKVGKVNPSVASKQPASTSKPLEIPVKLPERLEMTLRAVEDEDLRASIRKAMEAQVQTSPSS